MGRCCLLFVLCVGFRGMAADVTILDNLFPWQEARSECRKLGTTGSCDLITRQRLDEEWSNLVLYDNEDFWVGGQRLYQWLWHENDKPNLPLFQSEGCYDVTVGGGDIVHMDFNGPYQCSPYCNVDKIIYLQDLKCHCSSALKGESVSRDKCDVTCNGSNDTCGGKDEYFSVYSLPSRIEFEDKDKLADCALGRLFGTNAADYYLSIQSTNCERYHHYFCLSDLQSDKVSQRLEKFTTAVSRCGSDAKGNSSLPTLTDYSRTGQLVTDFKMLLDKLGVSNNAFWLPLQRYVSAVWVDGEEGEQGGQPGSCIAATPETASYRLADLPCIDRHRAICYCANGDDSNKDGTSDSDKGEQGRMLKLGAIIMGVVSVLLVAVIAGVFIFIRRRRSSSEVDFERQNNPMYRGSPS